MYRLAAFMLLACLTHGRRLNAAPEDGLAAENQEQPTTVSNVPDSQSLVESNARTGGTLHPLRSLALLSLAVNPAVAFNPSVRGRDLVSTRSSSLVMQRTAAMNRRTPTMSAAPQIKLYTNKMCPYAQRVWIALEAAGLPFEMQEVSLYGGGGFDKAALRQVEAKGGLAPKGYIPVMSVDDEVLRESSAVVERVSELSAETQGAQSLLPEQPEVAADLISLCNDLPNSPRSRELGELLRKADAQLKQSKFLAGDTFSVADACLLPFLQRVEEDGGITAALPQLSKYMENARSLPAFSKTIASSWWWWW